MKSIFKCLVLSAFTFVFAGSSYATSFDFSDALVGGTIFNNGIQEARFNNFVSSAEGTTVRFDAIDGNVGNLSIGINGAANVRNTLTNEVNSTDFTLGIIIENATALLDGSGGIIGYIGNAASSVGSLFLEDIGDNRFLQTDIEAKFMNFATDPRANDPEHFISEIAQYGNANFFLWDSNVRGGLAANLWFGSSNTLVNGVGGNFSVRGDIHLSNGAEVPEPMTAALLGMGLLGGAIRRKKEA